MAVDLSVSVSRSDTAIYAEVLFDMLSQGKFNLLVESRGLSKTGTDRKLKFCGREVDMLFRSETGQASISLKPGGSIAWDTNNERVVLHFKANGDIVIERLMSVSSSKKITCTRNPI